MATSVAYIPFTLSVPVPKSSNRATADRQRQELDRALRTLQDLVNHVTPDELATISTHVNRALQEPSVCWEQSDLVNELTDGHHYTAAERAALEMNALTRSFQRRRDLLEDSLTASQVAELLGTSRQTPHDRAKSDTLLGVLDRGALRFPAWQFDPEGPDGVIAGLPAVLHALCVSPLAKVSWLLRPNRALGMEAPLAVLKRGEVQRVVDEAEVVGVS